MKSPIRQYKAISHFNKIKNAESTVSHDLSLQPHFGTNPYSALDSCDKAEIQSSSTSSSSSGSRESILDRSIMDDSPFTTTGAQTPSIRVEDQSR